MNIDLLSVVEHYPAIAYVVLFVKRAHFGERYAHGLFACVHLVRYFFMNGKKKVLRTIFTIFAQFLRTSFCAQCSRKICAQEF